MGEILKEWLSERLNQQFTWEADNFGEVMKDGHIVARLLYSYGAVRHEDYALVLPASTSKEISNNWKHIIIWLQNLEVHLEQTEVNEIMEGRGLTSMKLFYQLFLNLDKKDRIDFIKKERKLVSSLVTKIGKRFNVEKIDEEKIPAVDNLAKPLIDEKFFIEWQKKKSEQLQQTYDYVRSKFMKTIEKMEEARTPVKRELPEKTYKFRKEKYNIDKFERLHSGTTYQYTYEQLLELEEKAKAEEGKNILDEEWARSYLDNLQQKFANKSETEEFHRHMRTAMSSYLWEETIGEEETKFDLELAEKVMKLSHFEKQMCTQLMETKQQARNIIDNRMQAQREFDEQREHQFGQYLDDLKNQMHMELVEVDLEKQRQEELHKRLYTEKIRRKKEKYYEICYETMLSIVDYATKFAYFKSLMESDDVPEYFTRQWKALYFKHQPIFDLIDKVEQTLEIEDVGEGVEVEEIVHLEFDRQNSQNENDFFEYHYTTNLWNVELLIPNYATESLERQAECLGLCVLGYIVHKLLELKYPLPIVKLPADLPSYKSRTILRCLPDRSITIPMQALLNNRKLHVVRIETAMNYCLHCFKTEMIGCADLNLSFDQSSPASSNSTLELIKLLSVEEQSMQNDNLLPAIIPPNAKQTQTPKTLPEENMVLSAPAELGRYAYEALCGGESPTDYLVCAIIVEYLRSVKDIEGFVLINYPNSYRQVQILEETILGKGPPDVEYIENADDIFLEPYLAKVNAKVEDIYADIRKSKLVPDPRGKIEAEPFVSYFTAYIQLKETANILEEFPIWYGESGEIIDQYYTSQYTNYSIYYEEIDKNVLAQICRLIIGDFEMPFKDYDSLFGPATLSCLEFPSSEDKRSKTKIMKHEPSTSSTMIKRKRNSKMSKLSLKENKSNISVEEASLMITPEIPVAEETCTEICVEEEIVEPTPGEENWTYANLPLSEKYGIILVTVWEEAERAYINDLGNLFFARRLQMNSLVPYTRFVRDKMEQIITRPSVKQDLVSKFHRQYNEFDEDFRFYKATKIEWNCRIRELQTALYDICDSRKKDALAERLRLILDHWTMEEVTAIANTFISCMQCELNRATLTYQLLHDFYFMLMKKPTPTERLVPKDLTKVMREIEKSPRSKQSGDDKIFSKVKQIFQEMHIKNIYMDHSSNPYNQVLDNNVIFATKTMTDLNMFYQTLIAKEATELSKITTSVKSAKKPAADTGPSSADVEEEILKQNLIKCLDEWKVAIDGEMHRTILRLQMLFGRALMDLKLFNEFISRTFQDIEQEVNGHYLREIEAVDHLCDYFQLAVERGEKIQECLILDLDRLIIDPNMQEFSSPLPNPPPAVVERESEGEFRIGDLARLREQLKLVAPAGIILGQSLIYLLQDFLLLGKETCSSCPVPRAWTQLEPEQIPELVFCMFGETVCADWRDLLIYSLGVRFPNITELFELRKCLREVDIGRKELISRNDFMKIDLWFEEDILTEDDSPQSRLRVHLMKQFLFELFEVSPDTTNYTGLLLALCKATDPRCGFAAAVSTAIGEVIFFDWQECEHVILRMIKQKEYREACRACAEACSEKFTNKLLDKVIVHCEGITISELEMTPSTLELQESNKKDKPKSAKAAKETEREKPLGNTRNLPGQSARSVLTSPATESKLDKLEQSNIEQGLEEAMEEGTEFEGEKAEEAQDALSYSTFTVPQDVIWNILQISLPWHFKCVSVEKEIPYAEQIETVLSTLANDTENGDIYLAKFLNDSVVVKILSKVSRFKALNILQEASRICEVDRT